MFDTFSKIAASCFFTNTNKIKNESQFVGGRKIAVGESAGWTVTSTAASPVQVTLLPSFRTFVCRLDCYFDSSS